MIAIRTTALLAMLAALAGCSERSPSGEANGASNGAAPAAAPSAPARPATAGCAEPIAVDLDRSEGAMVDWREIPAARLDAFRKQAAEAFRAAADGACHSQPKVAAALKPIRRLLVQSGSGATEPVFYQEDGKDDSLIFQYAFVEAKLAVPDRKATELGLRCWADPEWKECAEMGD